jgi:hypothetical protein
MIAVYNESQDLFISPLADGPIKYAGNMSELKSAQVINVTRHGRSFSVVHIPYSLKLLIQELQVLNVQMRIITDANIDSIESMAASKNIEMLMEPGADLATVGMETARTLGVENIKSNMFSHLKHSIDDEFGNGDGNNDDTDINDNDDTDDNDDENDDSVSIATNPNKKQDNTHKLKNKNKRTRNSLSTDFPDTLGLPSSESIKVVENHGWTLLPELSDRYGETFASIVTNESGKPTEYWHTVKREGKYPDRYPDGWLPGPKNKWESSRPLEIEDKVDALKRFPPPTRNNLKVAQEYILQFKSDKYPKIPFLFNKATSSDAANDFTNSATGMVLGPGFDTDKNEMFEGDSVAVLHSQLINVGKQISAIELSIQQIDQRSTNEDGVKNYTKEDTKELERLVRQLVSLQSNKDRLTKQLSDEQLVKSITSNIVSSNSDTTPGSVIYSPYTSTSPPYTSSSPVSPMMQPVMTAMPMQMPMQMPMPMQPMMVPVQMPSTTNQVNQVVKSQPDTNSNPDNTSGSSDSSTTKKIILNT